MLSKFFKILAFVWLLLLISSNHTIKASDRTAELKSLNVIDVCGGSNNIIVLVDIGDVAKSDMLYSYDLSILYDSSKVKFTFGVFNNTLSEFFEFKKAEFYDNGEAVLMAGQTNPALPPVSGTKELVGVYGQYLGNCPDSVLVKMRYIGFNQEFKDTVTEFKDTYIIARVEDKPNRKLDVIIDKDSLIYKEDDKQDYFDIKLNTFFESRLQNLKLNVINDNESYTIDSVKAINDKVNLIENKLYYSGEDSTRVTKVEINLNLNEAIDTLSALRVYVRELERDTVPGQIKVQDVTVNDCACITRIQNDNIYLKGIQKIDTTSGIKEDFNTPGVKAYYANEYFMVEPGENIINNVFIYNLAGELVDKIPVTGSNEKIQIYATKYPKGVYVLIFEKSKSKKEEAILINYSF